MVVAKDVAELNRETSRDTSHCWCNSVVQGYPGILKDVTKRIINFALCDVALRMRIS